MRLVYIAGPFRAPTSWDIEQNVRRAEEWSMKVAQAGHVPVCPHKMYQHFHGIGTDEFWLEATLATLRCCDAAVFIPGWTRSQGSLGELNEAKSMGIPHWTWDHNEPEAGNNDSFEAFLRGL